MMGMPANNPFGVPEQVSGNQFLAPVQNNPFGAPQANNPFGAPASRSASPFGAPPPVQSSVFGPPFGSAAQSQSNSVSLNPFGKPSSPAPSPFGAQPAIGGFGTQSAQEPAGENNMGSKKRNQNGKPFSNQGSARSSPAASGFGTQGANTGSQRASVFGKNMDKSLVKTQSKSQNPKSNGRTERFQSSTIDRNASLGTRLERTKELSPFAFDFANKLYAHLKKEKLSPPSMPAEPGNPKNRAAIDSTKESFKKYRTRVYASLRKVDYIDDPEKRRRLEDALPFKGICEDMCPEFERVARISEYDVKTEEKKLGSDGSMWPEPSKMVKKFGRSAAGQDAPLPMDVRSVAALQRTVDYLFKDLLQTENNLPSMHNYLWDRTRAVRKDFTFHSQKSREEMKVMVYIFETITRFHATALHLLSRKGFANDDFDQKQEIEQLGRTILSLMEAYNVCHELDVVCPNEPEFRAYYLLLNAHDPSITKRILTWGKETWFQSQEVQTALSLISVMDDIREPKGPLKPRKSPTLTATAFRTFFTIVENPRVSYTMACIAEVHFTYVRQNILKNFVKGYARHRDAPRTITASDLNKVLRFDTDEEAVEFAELHDFEFTEWVPQGKNPVSERYLLLNEKKRGVPSPRVRQSYSGMLVERKRTTESIVDAIYTTIYEKSGGQLAQTTAKDDSDSLFVSQTAPSIFAPATAPPAPFGGISVNNTSFQNGFIPQQPAAAPMSSVFPGLQNSQPATSASPFGGFNKPATNSPAAAPTTSSIPFAASSTPFFGQPVNSTPAPFSAAPKAAPLFSGIGATATSAPVSSTPAFLPPFGQPAPKTEATKSPFQSITQQQPASTSLNAPKMLPNLGQPIQSSQPSQSVESTTPKKSLFPSLDVATSSPTASSFPAAGQKPLPSFGNVAPPPFTAPSSTQASKPLETAQPSPSFLGLGTPAAPATKPDMSTSSSQPTSTPAAPSIFISQPSSALPSEPSTASIFKPTPAQPSAPPFQLAGQQPLSGAPSSLFGAAIEKPPPPPPRPPPPPKRDLLGDVTKWFVLGDNGLVEQFTENTIQNMLWEIFEAYQKHEEYKRRKAEDDESWRVAREHMAYRLGVKFFYRWRENARKLAQRRILREGKQKMREYREQQWARKKLEEETRLKAEQDARRAARRKAESDRVELALIAKMSGQRRRNSIAFSTDGTHPEEQLLKSGIFAGLRDEKGLARRAVNNDVSGADSWAGVSKSYYRYPESELELEPAPAGMRDSPDNASSVGGRREGWKTRSLREKFGIEPRRSMSASGSVNGNFRSSLPLNRSTNFSAVVTPSGKRSVAASSDGGGGEPDPKRKSIMSAAGSTAGVSVVSKSRHWDLRARGFVPMPDGNWLPESMVHSARSSRENLVDVPVVAASDGEDEPNSLRARLNRLKQGSKLFGHSAKQSLDLPYSRSRAGGSSVGGGMSPPAPGPPPPPLWKDSVVLASKRKRVDSVRGGGGGGGGEGGGDVEMDHDDDDEEREISPPEKKLFTTAAVTSTSRPHQDTNAMVAKTRRMLDELRETMDRLDQDNRALYQEQGIGL